MNEMVERVELVLHDFLQGEMTIPEAARAAIAAMREPTEAMLIGARDWSLKKNGMGVGNDQATGCWQAMIDAALVSERGAEE